MSVRPIILYPNQSLLRIAQPVTRFDADLARLAADVLDTMRAAPGIGMTACHIGSLQRVAVIELAAETGPEIYVNPEITWHSEERAAHIEGSVSMPGVTAEIERPARVRVRYRDLAGIEKTVEAAGLLGVCLQHEIDQLDGIFWIQRLSRLRRDRLVKRFEKRLRSGA